MLGDFDDARFEHHGVVSHFRRDGADFVIETEDGDGVRRSFPVVGVVGIEPLQQYLLETEPGRTQSFDVAWDTEGARWYPLYPDQDLPPGDGLHWTGPYKTWNARCAECHATGYTRNYDADADSTPRDCRDRCRLRGLPWPRKRACRLGGGRRRIRPGRPRRRRRARSHRRSRRRRRRDEIQQCATCHSRREAHGDGNPVPGTPYHDAYTLALLRPGLYHADGQILDEVFVYGSFLQSKMYAHGVSCTDCHEPHGGELVAEGNAVCAQCHSPAGNPASRR